MFAIVLRIGNTIGGLMKESNAIREKQITRTSLIGILANVFLASFKAVSGLLAGSISIILDAVNNLTDALSSTITIAGIKLARKKPDRNHPYGHGRIEYFSAIIIAIIIVTAGVTSLIESVRKFFDPVVPEYSVLTVIIIIIAIITKLILGRFVSSQGHKLNSEALTASGADATMDAILSASTLLGAAITLIWHISVDAYIGAAISAFIIKAGIEMLMSPISQVIGTRPDSEITTGIKRTVRSIPGVLGAYDLILHDYGHDSAIGSIHIEIDKDMSAQELHRLTMTIQHTIFEEYHVTLTVGIYSVDTSDSMRAHIFEIVKGLDGVIGTHGFYRDEEHMTLYFDTVITFNILDKEAFAREISAGIEAEYPGYNIVVHFDTDYSD